MANRRRYGVVTLGILLVIFGKPLCPRAAQAVDNGAAMPPATSAQPPAAAAQTPPPNPAEALASPPAAPLPAAPPLPPGDAAAFAPANLRTIDFATALRLTGAQNPQIAAANQRIAEAYAQLRGARSLWLPAIRAGVSYNRHDGPMQATDGSISRVSRSSLESGLGTFAVGSGSPAIPGLTVNVRVTDAVFQPRIFGHLTAAQESLARATCHDLLLAAALAYLDLLRAYQQEAITQDTLENARLLAELTATFARAGQGAQADADRAQVELVLRENELEQSREATQVASTRLVEVLSLDPTLLLAPAEPTIVPVELVAPDRPIHELVTLGLTQRPELAESQQLVCAALSRMQRERYASLLPSMFLGASYSEFGGGPDAVIENSSGRVDFDAIMYWEVRGLGVGELAARGEARARVQQAESRKVQVMDRVAREVAEGYWQVRARRKQIQVAQAGVQAGIDSYQRNYQRIRQGQGLPIETLQSIQALDQARREYLRALTDYDDAQFRLYRAIGCALSDGRVQLSQPGGP